MLLRTETSITCFLKKLTIITLTDTSIIYFLLNVVWLQLNVVWFRPPRTKTAVYGPSIRPPVHVDNGPKFGHRPSISWTESDNRPRLSF